MHEVVGLTIPRNFELPLAESIAYERLRLGGTTHV